MKELTAAISVFKETSRSTESGISKDYQASIDVNRLTKMGCFLEGKEESR